jgi:hypothetical protein
MLTLNGRSGSKNYMQLINIIYAIRKLSQFDQFHVKISFSLDLICFTFSIFIVFDPTAF